MYRNLLAEMARFEITQKDIAELLKVRTSTVCDKINGKYSFKLEEAFEIKESFFPKLSIEYLFDKDINISS